jgi:arabinofuranosyltransferase
VAAALALPLVYQLFRMGYFASLVPNTAVAKEAGETYLSSGLRYFKDLFGRSYVLILPVAALLAWFAWDLRDDLRRAQRRRAFVAAAPVAGGALHILFVVKVGGDFMHARLLMPGLFALLIPVAVLPVPLRRATLAVAAAIGVWAVVCAVALRVPYHDDGLSVDDKDLSIVDERAYYVALAGGVKNPVRVEDYRRSDSGAEGFRARERAEAGERVVTFMGRNPEEQSELPVDHPSRPGLRVPFVAAVANVGVFGYAAGPRVYVEDRLALGDPVAARLEVEERGRVGHEKLLPTAFVLGRFADPETYQSDGWVWAAGAIFTCEAWIWDGQGARPSNWLREQLAAMNEPLTAGRFVSNMKLSITTPKLRFSEVPPRAKEQLCGPY